jgi:hypothetical protein
MPYFIFRVGDSSIFFCHLSPFSHSHITLSFSVVHTFYLIEVLIP